MTSAAHHSLDHALAWSHLRRTRQTRARSSHYWKRWLRHNVMQI
jgi:hypothetical protein